MNHSITPGLDIENSSGSIAIIGMAGRFPGANHIQQFWKNLRDGVESVTQFSDEEVLKAGADPSMLQDRHYVKAGAVLEGVEMFDASFFGLTPREVQIMDPQHRLFLEAAWNAIEHAGYDPSRYGGTIGVFAGTGISSYLLNNLYPNRELWESIGLLPIILGNDKDSLTTRVAYFLDLTGPCYSIQTYCSTSLVAVSVACENLLSGTCDMALAGGVYISVPQNVGYYYQEGGIASPDARCRAFDAKAKGSPLGNGVAVVLLKRLSDAITDGDTIHGIIKGWAVTNDGALRVGYTAPGVRGQAGVMLEALANAEVDAESISYIEAHGTGTALGDAVEFAAMVKAFREYTQEKGFCAVGSVKTNIGHLDRAAGVTGLIKTVLALQHKQIPPSLNYENPNPEIDFSQTPFFVNTELRDWQPLNGHPRRAGVSSFGMGGTNAHVVLEEAPPTSFSVATRPYQLLPLSAKTATALETATQNLAQAIQEDPNINMADVAYTLQVGRKAFEHRRILVCQGQADAVKLLSKNVSQLPGGIYATQERSVAFMFAGVGDHYPHLARELYEFELVFREAVDECCTFLHPILNLDLRHVLFPGDASAVHTAVASFNLRQMLGQTGAQTETLLNETHIAQPTLFIIEYALAQLLRSWGIEPNALIGYSLGEYVAACVAGVLSLPDALTLVARRAQMIQSLPTGKMIAVSLSKDEVQPFLNEFISLAVVNTPSTCVLAGSSEAITQLEAQLVSQEIICRPLTISHAFHSFMMHSMVDEFLALLKQFTFRPPQIPYLSNVTGTWITEEEATNPAYWVQHLCQTVQFDSGLNELLSDPNRILLEIGPGQSLVSFAKQHPACRREQLGFILPTLRHAYDSRSDEAFLLETLGKLWLTGYPIDWQCFYGDEHRQRIPLPTYPFERERYWIEPPATTAVIPSKQSTPQGKKGSATDWFYEPVWEDWPLLHKKEKTAESWLLFEDSLGWGEQLGQQLRQKGSTVIRVQMGERFAQLADHLFTIRPDALADYEALCGACQETMGFIPSHIIHLWSLQNIKTDLASREQFQAAQRVGFYSLLYLAQALGEQRTAQAIELNVLTNQAQPIGGEPMHPEQATVFGLCRVIPQEYQSIRCRTLDISLSPQTQPDEAWSQLFIAELLAPIADVAIAYRGESRYVQRFVPKRITVESDTPSLRPQGVYLITGGLGNIGLALADHLAKQTQGTLILTSRVGLPPRDEWAAWLADHPTENRTSHKIRQVQMIEATGAEVVVAAVDSANETQMEALVADIYRRFHRLDGVIHAAGVTTADVLKGLQDTDHRVCETHFAAKAYGLYVLHNVLVGKEIDFCFLFSSLSAVLGGLGFAAYAAANTFMDAYTHAHRRSFSSRWMTVDWDTWQFAPMQMSDMPPGATTVSLFEMTPEEGVAAFALALASGETQLVNSTGDLEDRIRQWVMLEALTAPPGSIQTTHARPALTTSYVSAATDYERRIATIWENILGIEGIGIHDNFFDLGGNSLIGLQAIRQVQKEFNIQVPAVALFEAPTVSTLARYLQPNSTEEDDAEKANLIKRRNRARKNVEHEGIAIVAMNGRFPGANSVSELWENLCNGVETISFFTDEELLEAGTSPALLRTPNFVKARPILEGIDLFDAAFFGYSPREAEMMDPQHRLFLECAWESLELAGYSPDTYKGLIGVFAGANISTYLLSWYHNPDIQESANLYQLVIGADKDALPTATSYKLNLRGPSFAVQTFCSTSLVATHLACQSLLSGECDMALAGGVSIRVPAKQGYVYQEGGMDSSDGHCRPFDAGADGTLFGDGVAIVVLKRLEDAIADGDNIYAVIKGSAVNNDGSLKVGYTAPSVAGQSEVIQAALENANVHPETIGFVEAHGTATRLGDPIEVTSLTRAFQAYTDQKRYCVIGSVKSNVGHLDRAAGVTGLIKASLAAKHGIIPPTLYFESPNPEIDFNNSPFYVVTELKKWERRNRTPRRASVNSLGLGGTNVHIIVEEPPAIPPSAPSRSWQLLLLSARTETAMDLMTLNLTQHLRENPDVHLADVAYTLQAGRYGFEHRRMVVCQDTNDAIQALESVEPGRVFNRYQPDVNRSVAFMFAGVGDHYPHMLRELYEKERVFREAVDQCCQFLRPILGLDLREVLYPAGVTAGSSNTGLDLRQMLGRNGHASSTPKSQLAQTELAQPAVFVVEYALARLLQTWKVKPSAMIGYSLGEYVAACIAGVFSLEDALTLVTRRAQLIQQLPVGGMVAVSVSETAVQPFLNNSVSIAVVNGPQNCVLAGPLESLVELEEQLQRSGVTYRRLETNHAFHSEMMQPIVATFAELVARIKLHAPQIPYLSNVTGDWIRPEEATDPAYWVRHLCQTVRFGDGVRVLLQNSDYFLLEIGPGHSLSSFAKQHPQSTREHLSLIAPTIRHTYDQQSDVAFLLNTLGKLWLSGYKIGWGEFYADEQRRRVILPTYPFERHRFWIDPEPGTAAVLPSSITASKKEDIADWFYVPVWEKSALPKTREKTGVTCLIFADKSGWAIRLSQQLQQQRTAVIQVQPGTRFARLGDDLFTIQPDVVADYQALFAALHRAGQMPQKIIHLWSITAPTEGFTSIETFQMAQSWGFYSLLYLTKALTETGDVTQSTQIFVISNNMQPVKDGETIDPEKSTLLGPCRVIPQENRNIRCRAIDITFPADEQASSTLVTHLTNELFTSIKDVTVAYREGERYVQTFVPERLTAEPTEQQLRPNGVYLITGGLGGIGLALTEYLFKQFHARLVLTNRSGLPPHHTWEQWLSQRPANDPTSAKIRKIQSLEALGAEVLVMAADAGDETQMQAVIDQTYQRFGTLNGVIHGAGLVSLDAVRVVQNIDRDICEAHFRPKAHGVYVLEKVLQGHKLDFCLLLSSVSSVLGGLGFVAYTAANIFMDTYAHAHNRRRTTPWTSVNWDTWKVGLHDSQIFANATVAVFEMSPEEGVQAFARAVASGATQLINSTGDLQARLRQWVLFDDVSPKTAVKRRSYARPSLPTAYVAVSNQYEKRIAAIWEDILGIEQIGIQDNFFDLGGNSLVGLDVIARLQKEFNTLISPVALFEAPTISALARYLQPAASAETSSEGAILSERRRQARQKVENQGIAVIAMTGRFPGANSVSQFWENLCRGVESISFFTDEELLESGVDPALLNKPNYVKARPIIANADLFDAGFFGYSPREAEFLDPQYRVFLECAWESLELAGYNTETYKGLIGVFAGSNISTYMLGWYSDPQLSASVSDHQLVISGDKDSLTTIVSYKLNLKGPSFAVQTFCSTALVATHLACQSLLNGECDMALAGGVAIRAPQKMGYLYEEGGMESPDGHCRTFDAQAKGTLFGDGVGIVVLKRLEDALEDGDTIQAVIRGSAINNDGSLKVGYTAPSVTGQAEAVIMAMENAGVNPKSVGYIEAHGTATELGDPIEISSLTQAYRKFTEQKGFCAIGSVKTNVGHLDRAAGVVGLIKTVLTVKSGVIPPSLHFESPNPAIDFASTPFYVNTKLSTWASQNGSPRRAALNSLGMGGTNAHVIVEEPPVQRPSGESRPWHLLPLSARTESALDVATTNLAHYFRQNPQANIADVAYTLQVGRRTFACRRMVVCRSAHDGLAALESLSPQWVFSRYQPDVSRPVAFMFPGVGDHYLRMAKELYEGETLFREIVEECCRVLYPHLGIKIRDLLYPPDETARAQSNGTSSDLRAMLGRNGSVTSPAAQKLNETAVVQPVVFVIEYALANLLMSWGIQPQALVGYSLGEYVAACLAGVISLEDALKLVATRARLIQSLPEGKMLAVSLSLEEVHHLLSKGISLAAHNGNKMCVLAGTPEAIAQVERELTQQGISCRQIDTTHAFHSTMMEPLHQTLTELVQTIRLNPPRIPYLSNVTGTWITPEQATDPSYWAQHMTQPVRFFESLAELLKNKDQVILEVGPGQGLASFAKQHPVCDREQLAFILPTMRSAYDSQADLAVLLHTVGKFWLLGGVPDWSQFYKEEDRHRVPLPTYPFEHQSYWLKPTPKHLRAHISLKPSGSLETAITSLPRLELAEWFYLPGWKQTVPLTPQLASESQERSCWLLFLDECGVGNEVATWLASQHQSVVVVEQGDIFSQKSKQRYSLQPGIREDYLLLLRSLQQQGVTPAHIVHLWSVTAVEHPTEDQLTLSFYSPMVLAQALGELGLASCVLSVVTSHAQNVLGYEMLHPIKATALGPSRVIPLEYADMKGRCIDILLAPANSWQAQSLVTNLLGELTADVTDTLVALRGHQRWVQALEPAKLPLQKDSLRLRPEGVYLITGGLGGIGLAIAEYLAQTAQARLILVGRSSLPPRDEWTTTLSTQGSEKGIGRRIHHIQQLEALGAKVLVKAADVTNQAQMTAVVQEGVSQFGAIHGVIHAAGVPGMGVIQLKTRSLASQVLAPKLHGTLVLEQVLQKVDLDFMVLFSSITTMSGGGPGQIDYCAANAFLDTYAQSCIGRKRLTTAINWGEWHWNAWDEGLEGFKSDVQAFLRENRQRFGIDFAGGQEAFARVLSNHLPQIIVSTQDFRQLVEIGRQFTIKQVLEWGHSDEQTRQKYPRPALGTSYVAPRNETERKIVTMWEEILGISEIGIHDNFFDLGGNSLIGLDLVVRLRKEFHLENLPAYVLYESPSVRAMAEFVVIGQQPVDLMSENKDRSAKRRERFEQQRSRIRR